MKKGKLWLAGYACLLCLLVWSWVLMNLRTPVVEAEGGTAVIRLDEGRAAMLVGEVYRYEGALAPEELAEAEGVLYAGLRRERKMEGYTYAFTLVDTGEDTAFLLPRPHDSRLWINGARVGAEGREWIEGSDIFLLGRYGAGPYEVVLQVRGSTAYNGYQGLLFGSYKVLERTGQGWLTLDIVALGLSLMLVVQCMALFLSKRSERYLLLLAVATVMELCHFMLIPRHGMLALALPGSVAFYAQFTFMKWFMVKQFVPGVAPKWLDRLIVAVVVATAGVVLLLPGQAATFVRGVSTLYTVCCIWLLAAGILRGVREAPVILLGVVVAFSNEVFYSLLNWGWVPQGVVDVVIVPAQYLRFATLLGFSVAACMRYAGGFKQAEVLSAELEQRVEQQTAEIRAGAERLRDTQKRNQRFITGVVHNLRNPLFALGGYIDLLRDEAAGLDAAQQGHVDAIDRKLGEVNGMVDDMLLLSRLEDGAVEFHFTDVDAPALLADVVRDMRVRAEDAGAALALDCEAALVVAADGYRLRQAVDILLDNALHHSGGTRIELGARRKGARALLWVRDDGVGMAEEQAGHCFEGYSIGRGKKGSMGLGLSIARELVEGHGGTLALETGAGMGCCFTITLPQQGL